MQEKKILAISSFCLFLFFLLTVKIIFAQTTNSIGNIISNPVPIGDCGIAGAEGGKDKCCYMNYISLPDPPKLPVDPFGANKKGDELKRKFDQIKNLVQKACFLGEPSTDITDPNCKCVLSLTPTAIPEIKKLCERYLKEEERIICENCSEGGALWTGIGCIPLTVSSLINDYLLKIGIGLGGILALLCIIYAAFQIQTSQGSPEKIKKGQELLTSCIMGLMLIIFSVFILKLIGVDILRIPGFGR